MAHRDSTKQTVEKERSPPDRERISPESDLFPWPGCTCPVEHTKNIYKRIHTLAYIYTYINILLFSHSDGKGFILVVKCHTPSVASLIQHVVKVVFTTSWEKSSNRCRKKCWRDRKITRHIKSIFCPPVFENLPPELSIYIESAVHNVVQALDEGVEALHLLCDVLVVLQSLTVLSGWNEKISAHVCAIINVLYPHGTIIGEVNFLQDK